MFSWPLPGVPVAVNLRAPIRLNQSSKFLDNALRAKWSLALADCVEDLCFVFGVRGIFYAPAEKTKSELYRDLLPIINSGAVDLIEHDRPMMQLTSMSGERHAVEETQSKMPQGSR